MSSATIFAQRRAFWWYVFHCGKTTGIFCRPICPATPPKEENVEYFSHQVQALVQATDLVYAVVTRQCSFHQHGKGLKPLS
ncbi:hypothetical protein OK016_28495 [Vibrio chagasii]|nr:hypothetical protein [Vibrio chagasii]